MNLKHKVRLALVLAGILVLLFAITSAGAQPKAEAVVTIAADQNLYAAQQDVVIYVTFSNPTKHSIRVLQWYTPVDGVEEPLFKVSVDGAPVAYTGPIYRVRRSSPYFSFSSSTSSLMRARILPGLASRSSR